MIFSFISLLITSALVQRELQKETHPGVKMWCKRAMWTLIGAMALQSTILVVVAVVFTFFALLLRTRVPESIYDEDM